MRAVVLFALLAGCDHLFFLVPIGPDGPVAPIGDVVRADLDAQTCFGTGMGLIKSVCLPDGFVVAPDVVATTIDTGTDCSFTVAQTTGGPSLCVVAAASIDIDSSLSVTGPVPLVLLATTTMMISGSIDAASHAGIIGPGADVTCNQGNVAGSRDSGAAGGSFAAAGGSGGAGHDEQMGGQPDPGIPLATIRGGCPAGVGGSSSNQPASSGGAVYLIAGTEIDVTPTGWIDASGQGGFAALANSGGDGGASGGLIAFDAPSVTIEPGATAFAIGGGGAGGGGLSTGSGGGGDATVGSLVGSGGGGGDSAGNGGDGSSAASAAGGDGGSVTDSVARLPIGGGGGGGGDGFIRVFAIAEHVQAGSIVVPLAP